MKLSTGLKERFKLGLVSRDEAITECDVWDNKIAITRFRNWLAQRKSFYPKDVK